MAVRIPCPHCKKEQEPILDPKKDQVSCTLCNEIIDVNHFVKVQLKALKQYGEIKRVPFGVKCDKCNKNETPVEQDGEIVCGACHKPLSNLTDTFKRMLQDKLSRVKKDI